MWVFYFLSCIPVIVGFILFLKHKEVIWWEWLIPSIMSFLIAFFMEKIAFNSQTKDFETRSGRVTSAIYEPAWTERYTQRESYSCGTTKNPKTCHRNVTKTAHHPDQWYLTCTINTRFYVTKNVYDQVASKFGSSQKNIGEQSRGHAGGRVISGDNNAYQVSNSTGYVFPTTATFPVTNRILGAPTLFGFKKVPETAGVYPYPSNPTQMESGRLLGTAKKEFSTRAIDILNSNVGPRVFANVVLVGFGTSDSSLGHLQEAKWVGGKKNDIVICYGPGWSYCFGWTENEIVKRNIETMFLNGAKNDALLDSLSKEIMTNYKLVNWSKFDYISIRPPFWSYIVFIVMQLIFQIGFYIFACNNEHGKSGLGRIRFNSYSYNG